MSSQKLKNSHRMQFSARMEILLTSNVMAGFFWMEEFQIHGLKDIVRHVGPEDHQFVPTGLCPLLGETDSSGILSRDSRRIRIPDFCA